MRTIGNCGRLRFGAWIVRELEQVDFWSWSKWIWELHDYDSVFFMFFVSFGGLPTE